MQGKDRYLRKNSKYIFAVFFAVLFFFSFQTKGFSDQEITRLNSYIKNLENFSSNFLQIDNTTQETGALYVGEKRIRLEYVDPSKLSLIINNKRGMYVNHDLEEVQFFKTKDSLASIVFDLFKKNDFLINFSISKKPNEKTIELSKSFNKDDIIMNIKVRFEKSPIVLRSIEYSSEASYIKVSFYNHMYEVDFDDSFFSMAPPYQ